MSDNSFLVIIRGGTHLSGSTVDGVYRVDWGRVLPKNYRQFKLDVYFRDTPNSNTDNFVFIECSAFSRRGMYDTKAQSLSNVIGVAPSYLQSGTLYYRESPTTTPTITAEYPTENTFQLKLTDISGNTLTAANYTSWVLCLSFRPVASSIIRNPASAEIRDARGHLVRLNDI